MYMYSACFAGTVTSCVSSKPTNCPAVPLKVSRAFCPERGILTASGVLLASVPVTSLLKVSVALEDTPAGGATITQYVPACARFGRFNPHPPPGLAVRQLTLLINAPSEPRYTYSHVALPLAGESVSPVIPKPRFTPAVDATKLSVCDSPLSVVMFSGGPSMVSSPGGLSVSVKLEVAA